MKILCIYHANCADGLGAAWAVHRALGDNVEFVAAKYGEVWPWYDAREIDRGHHNKLTGRDILIVDFSYPLSVLRAMAQEARSVLVLDHHKSAQEDLKDLPKPPIDFLNWRVGGGLADNFGDVQNLAAIFDIGRSGAGLTWDYLNPTSPRPRIIDLIEDRDLWHFKHDPETRQFHASLTSHDWGDLTTPCYGFNNALQMLDIWNEWATIAEARKRKIEAGARTLDPSSMEVNWYDILREGSAIVRAQRQLIYGILRATRRTMKIAGHVVPVANVPAVLASEAGNLLCQTHAIEQSILKEMNLGGMRYDDNSIGRIEDAVLSGIEGQQLPAFSATYYDGADGCRHFSLRSPEAGADVGKIAQRMAFNFNRERLGRYRDLKGEKEWVGGGHEHAAGFDAPLGWEGWG